MKLQTVGGEWVAEGLGWGLGWCNKSGSHLSWPEGAERTLDLESCRVKKGPKEVGPGGPSWGRQTHPVSEQPQVPQDPVCPCARAHTGMEGCLRQCLTCAAIQAEPPLLVATDHAVAGLLGARAREGGQLQHLRAKWGVLGHLHAVLGVQEHGQVVFQAHHRDRDGAQRGQREWGAQVRGADGELQCRLRPDPQRLLQPNHACGGLDGKVAFRRVRQRVNYLGIGACGRDPGRLEG